MPTWVLIGVPAACFWLMILLFALGLCKAASDVESSDRGGEHVRRRPLASGSTTAGRRSPGPLVGAPSRPSWLSPEDERELLDLFDRWPSRYPDGTRDDTTAAFDVIADSLAAPGHDPDAA